jgi:LuxR family maltose regulon positive regulatory protein
METPMPILSAKLFIPPRRAMLVSRPRRVERLNRGLQGPLTLISAPAGFGKTTLVSEWRASEAGRDVKLAWLALDLFCGAACLAV